MRTHVKERTVDFCVCCGCLINVVVVVVTRLWLWMNHGLCLRKGKVE